MSVVPLPPEFRLERYFAIHEFSARYLLCCSDAEALSMSQLLEMANEEEMKMWNQLKLGYTESQGDLDSLSWIAADLQNAYG